METKTRNSPFDGHATQSIYRREASPAYAGCMCTVYNYRVFVSHSRYLAAWVDVPSACSIRVLKRVPWLVSPVGKGANQAFDKFVVVVCQRESIELKVNGRDKYFNVAGKKYLANA